MIRALKITLLTLSLERRSVSFSLYVWWNYLISGGDPGSQVYYTEQFNSGKAGIDRRLNFPAFRTFWCSQPGPFHKKSWLRRLVANILLNVQPNPFSRLNVMRCVLDIRDLQITVKNKVLQCCQSMRHLRQNNCGNGPKIRKDKRPIPLLSQLNACFGYDL